MGIIEKYEMVTLRDNGLRCFVPPCFMYDLIKGDGRIVATVSFVESYSALGVEVQDIIERSSLQDTRVSGFVSEYTENVGGANIKGLKFTITKMHK